MTTRREFLNRTLLGGVAFGAGVVGGWRPFRAGQSPSPWSLAARVPTGGEAGLEALARRLGLDVSRGEWLPLADGDSADLALLYEGRLLDPAEWPAEASALRARWSGSHASKWLRLTEEGRQAARRAVVTGADGVLAAIDLDRQGERAFTGRAGHRLVLSSRDGRVAVVEATCAHRHCLRQGSVRLSGERLVCAPAGLLVTLEA